MMSLRCSRGDARPAVGNEARQGRGLGGGIYLGVMSLRDGL